MPISIANNDRFPGHLEKQTVLRVDRICGKNLPAAWKKELDPLLAQVRKAMADAGRQGGR